MGLCNVYNFSNNRTVKLSDSYGVQIKLTDLDMAKFKNVVGKYPWANEDLVITLPECVGVTIPEVSLKSETYKYGNNSRVYVYPDYEKPEDLKIDLIEHVVEKYTDTNTVRVGVVELLVNIFLSKLFDAMTFSYKLNDYIPELRITVYSNDFKREQYFYVFKNLKLSSYSKYTLDYSSTDICKWSLTFSYQAYLQEFPKETSDDADKMFGKNQAISDITESFQQPEPPTNNPAPPERPADEQKENEVQLADNNTKAVDTPVDNNTDKVDELAYKMMRGELGNGKARQEAAKAAGYSDEEIKAAQAIVNQRDWNGLKERHDARVAAAGNAPGDEIKSSSTKSAATSETPKENEITTEPPAKNETKEDASKTETVTKTEKAVSETELSNAATLANAKDLAGANENTSKIVTTSTTKEKPDAATPNDDRIDELAYQMMRGTYDNGNTRIKRTLAADYTEEERKAAQSIVNQKDWNALKERHDARVAAENERKTEALANANNGLSREPAPRETSPVVTAQSNLQSGGDSADAAYKAALAKASESAPKENTAVAGLSAEGKKTETKEKKSNTETIATKTTTTKEDGKTVKTTTTVAQFNGFDADREKKISEYAAKRYKEELAKGKVKNTQMLIEKIDMEARTAYAEGKL